MTPQRKRFSTKVRAIWSPDIIARHHLDSFRRGKRGQVTQVHHIALGWMPVKQYYAMQKAHEMQPFLVETVRGGYAMNATIYGAIPSASIAGFGIPVPIGPALLAAAMLDLIEAIRERDNARIAKAAFKVFGPFGAVLQGIESLQGALGLGGSFLDPRTLEEKDEVTFDACIAECREKYPDRASDDYKRCRLACHGR